MNAHVPKTRMAERLLTSPDGATMPEIERATGGPRYNLLKSLEARGYSIRKVKEGRATRYFASPLATPSFEATVTSKGQITIPKEVRDALALHPGGKVRFTLDSESRAVMKPEMLSVQRLFGVLGKPPRIVTIEDMDRGIERAAVDRYLRTVGGKRR